jgi:D-alanyl-D-alanine carboxypeptidase/D-alanyl-D-alanine-endopeptidase (penicillin-binding protein 4)
MRVRVVVDPPMSTLKLDNRIKLTSGRCSWRKRRIRMHVVRFESAPEVRFSGTFPSACPEFELLRAVAQPGPYVFGAFKPMWEEMGGRIDGKWRAGLVADGAVRVHRASSRPLGELIRYMNKFSNNVMTRNLLLALGAHAYGAPGTLEKGRRAIDDWLLLNDIQAPELRVDNGSGLSREGRISALSLARVLLKSWATPFMPEFVSSLPLSALDGTLRKRFRKSDLRGNVHMKTGLLNGVRSIGGYMHTRSGRRLVVVSLHNHPGVQNGSGTAVQDALLEWLFEQ